MPSRYTIHQDLGVVITTFSGILEDAEFVALYEELYRHEDFELGMDEIGDLRDVEEFRISASALDEIHRTVERTYEGSGLTFRTAIVAPEDAAYGVARMYDALVSESPEEASVFRDLRSALEWLGLEEPPASLPLEPGDDAGEG